MSDLRTLEFDYPTAILRELFASAPMALQLYARDGRSVLVNPAHSALFGGVPPPEYNIFTDTILAERGLVDIIKRAFAGERISIPAHWYDIRELRNVTLDVSGGKRIAIASEMVPIRDATGEVAYVLLVFNDQTEVEQRVAQSALLAEASRMLAGSLDLETALAQVARLVTRTLADFVTVDLVDEAGKLRRLATVHSDPAAQPVLDEILAKIPLTDLTSRPSVRVVASGKPEVVPVFGHDTARINPAHQALVQKLGARSYVCLPFVLDKRVLGAISFVSVGDRRYSSADLPFLEALADRIAVAIDHAQLFRAAEVARADAEAATRAKDEFLAMLGHELRNPLAPIVTALELSQSGSKEHAIISRQVGHLRRLVDDLLDVSRITRGTLELDMAPVDLADAIADGIEAARPLIDQREQVLQLEIANGLFVHGDRVRLAQVITNLLVNAARYTQPRGRIDVQTRRIADEHHVVVRDNGAGMPADLLPRVFDVFTRGVDKANSGGGLGLGLAIVKSLTEQHGGRVMARSAGAGRGSELELVLPAIAEQRPASSPVSAPAKRARRGRVLVVDDNVDAAVMLAEGLERAGLTAIVAHDGPTALAVARDGSFDVAILDLGMPGMNGYELAVAIHASPGLEHLPLIAVTGFGQASDRARSLRTGFDSHFVKPVALETLLVALDLVMTAGTLDP